MKRVENAGFTLMELLITVALAAILLGIGVPAMTQFHASISAEATRNRLMREVRFARSQAIDLSQTVVICALDSDNKCGGSATDGLTIFIDSNNNQALDVGEEVLQVAESYGTGKVKLNTTALRFTPEGMITGQNGSLYFCSNDSNYVSGIIVSRGGSVRFALDSETTSCPI
ncbi:GspH/FimT family pseudopilin [Aliagarivorans marinus]|uniref:GspH/FimT family pseudopilin n=1 Tax=Aliagarivorans marinus TaxID=561965 RepID=UPI0012F9B838|nr:GspH/FimT family pseudopilin [Aliagarivorans marinus]